jgi:hypothetical protein
MFVPLKIAAAEVDRLKARIGDLDIPNIARESDDFYDALLKRCTKEDGTLDGSNLQQLTFPFDKPNYDVFISHSHNDGDSDKALYLYAWFKRCGLTCFIDEVLWRSSDELLRKIDKEYCPSTTPGMIDYEKSLYSSGHVHTMLSMSILEAINRSECCLFLESSSSLSLRNGIENKTLSPWIYQEIQFANYLPPIIPPRLKTASLRMFSDTDSILCENKREGQLQIEYKVDFKKFTPIVYSDLEALWGKGVSGLNDIYRKYFLKERHLRRGSGIYG